MDDESQSEPEASDETPSAEGQWVTLPSGLKVNEDQFLIVDPPPSGLIEEPPDLRRNA
ncbi:hypothetical protein GCM10009826_12740 [Humibacillus xanthopallidus]